MQEPTTYHTTRNCLGLDLLLPSLPSAQQAINLELVTTTIRILNKDPLIVPKKSKLAERLSNTRIEGEKKLLRQRRFLYMTIRSISLIDDASFLSTQFVDGSSNLMPNNELIFNRENETGLTSDDFERFGHHLISTDGEPRVIFAAISDPRIKLFETIACNVSRNLQLTIAIASQGEIHVFREGSFSTTFSPRTQETTLNQEDLPKAEAA